MRTSGRCLLRARRLLSALVVCAMVAACGSGGSANDTAHVKQTLTRAFRALAKGDGSTLCSLATPQGRQALTAGIPHTSCVGIVKLAGAHLSPSLKAALASVRIKRVTVNGNQASVSYADITSARGSLAGFIQPGATPTRLTKQPDGSWKISG